MQDLVQVKATVPRPLKRLVFAVLALREERFNRWLRGQMETLLRDSKTPAGDQAAAQGKTPEVSHV